MDQRRLGDTGLLVSQLALGMMSFGDTSRREWVLDERAAEPIVRRALDGGITFLDTADMYAAGASELVTGRLIRKLIDREAIVLATKVFYPTTPGPNGGGLSRKHILAAIDASLQRLQCDYVDLYQVHRWDPDTPIEETLEALDDVVRSGKARYIGASTMAAWQFAKAQALADRHGWTRFISMQNHYNLLYREEEREMIPLCRDQGIGVIPYSLLARGFLGGRRQADGNRRSLRSGSDPVQADLYGRSEDFDVVDALSDIAAERDLPPAQIALAWLMHKPGVTAPIVGATKPEHVDDAIAAATVSLTAEELGRLEAPYRPRPPLD
ncbi:MAG: aldo/keto reductase [Solirubrobacteraceae bacterium]